MNWNDRSDYLEGLLSALDGLEYYINDFISTGILYYDIFDSYNVTIGEQTYNCVMLNDEINITTGIEELIHTDMPEESETDYEKADKTDRRINQTYIIVDKQNQIIDSVVSNVTTQDNKISQITQTVDEINQKISDIADITVTAESNSAEVELERVNESEPILLKVHPIATNISKLYPRTNLYPATNLYMTIRKIRFIRTYQEDGETLTENIDYELPDDLLYYDSEHYDEFYLDYESQTCQVTKKCKYNADGSVSLLATPTINTYTYPTIELGAGDYEVQILSYAVGYIKATLMSENIYTTQFYTKVQTDSLIDQKADEITLGVSQTLSNYSTTNQMNTAIQLSASQITTSVNQQIQTIDGELQEINGELSLKIDKNDNEQIVSMLNASADVITLAGGSSINLTSAGKLIISAGNFKLNSQGNITATGGTIGGFTIGSTKLYNEKSSITSNTDGIYLGTDGISLGKGSTFKVTNEGVLTATSANISGTITSSNATITGGNIEITSNATSYNNAMLKFKSGNIKTYMSSRRFEMYDGSITSIAMDLTGSYEGFNYLSVMTPTLDFGVTGSEVWTTGSFVPGSLEKLKKNFEKLPSGLDIIKDIDIYKYNLKTEEDNIKKHIGFVIGDNYKYSKEITSKNNDGVDLYSFISICCKAIQEQQEEIEQLKEKNK